MKKEIKIAVGVGLAIGVTILAVRYSAKQRGFSRNKFIADTFNVPYKPMVDGLDRKYSDLEEQKENEATKDGIEFRATGDEPKARKFTTLDRCFGLCVAPKRCINGFCV